MQQIDFEEYRDDFNKALRLPKIGTNQAEILLMLLEGEHPTNRQMGMKLDSVSTGARVSELRALGWPINHKKIPYQTREGKRVAYCEYFLEQLQIFLKDLRVRKFIQSQRKR